MLKVKGMYTNNMVNYYVIETLDSEFFIFPVVPFRSVQKSELRPVYVGLHPDIVHRYLCRVSDWLPKLYGIEVVG